MTNRLAIVAGDFSNLDAGLSEVLREWTEAHVIERIAIVDVSRIVEDQSVRCSFASQGEVVESDLFDLVTSKIWDRVTVVAARSAKLISYSTEHFNAESELLRTLEAAFVDNAVTVLRSCTVSIIETSGVVAEAFAPDWGIHIAQEPVVRIDPAVASQPMRSEHRPMLVALLAMTVSGGFVWQPAPLLDAARDPVRGDHKPIRIGRAFLRVVNAGRLTDEILAGAFPPSGPWSVPGDLANARAVPPGTQVPEAVVDHLKNVGKFGYDPLRVKSKPKGTRVGLLDGVKLFFREFGSALLGLPMSMVASVRGEIESWVQKVTFGEDSSILLRFDPLSGEVDLDEITAEIQVLDIADGVEAVGSSAPWEALQKISFGLVDGGKYPDSFEPPRSGVHRLVFTDPLSIGPAPLHPLFEVLDAERTILELPEELVQIAPVDVSVATSLKERVTEKLEAVRNKPETVTVTGARPAPDPQPEPEEASQKDKSEVDAAPATSPSTPKSKRRRFLGKKKQAISTSGQPAIPPTEAPESGAISSEVGKEATAAAQVATSKSDQATTAIDQHIPGHPQFAPTEYEYAARFYRGDKPDKIQAFERTNADYQSKLDTTKIPKGNWAQEQTCDHCGTRFDYGVLIRHKPSGALIHIGRICAEKAYGVAAVSEYEIATLESLERRLSEWIDGQSKSLLWRVGSRIHAGRKEANDTLKLAVSIFAQRPAAQKAQATARGKFAKWTRRGFLVFVLILAGCIASVVFTPFPILVLALILATYATGLLTRLIFLARELVRVRYRLAQIEDQYERAFVQGRHAVSEMLRLTSVNEQFMDWQTIIREIVHVPFGRDTLFSSNAKAIEDVRRPAGFVLASAKPDDAQKMKPYLTARSQTMHAGWLSGIRDVLVEEWKSRYVNSRLLSAADNILPESDNASSQSVVGRHPFSNEEVFYPRSDLRRRLVGGRLQQRLIDDKSQQIAEDLRRTPIETLLGTVDVVGPGSALSGLPVRAFLSSLSKQPDEPVAFLPDLISDLHPELRDMAPEMILPSADLVDASVANVQVEPGVEFTAAAWVVELSGPIGPMTALRGIVSRPVNVTIEGLEPSDDDPSVS